MYQLSHHKHPQGLAENVRIKGRGQLPRPTWTKAGISLRGSCPRVCSPWGHQRAPGNPVSSQPCAQNPPWLPRQSESRVITWPPKVLHDELPLYPMILPLAPPPPRSPGVVVLNAGWHSSAQQRSAGPHRDNRYIIG